MPEPIHVNGSEIEPILLEMALFAGLFEADPQASGGEKGFKLNHQWFADPIRNVGVGVRTRGEALDRLLKAMLGQMSSNALGLPAKDPLQLGHWRPLTLNDTASGKKATPAALHIVSQLKETPKKEEKNDTSPAVVFGLGLRREWVFPPSSGGSPPLNLTVWAHVPLVRSGQGVTTLEQMPVVGVKGHPITLGLAISSADDTKPLVDAAGLSFTGGKIVAAIDVGDEANPVDVSIEVLKLKLPDSGDDPGQDRSLADLASMQPQDVVRTVASLALGAGMAAVNDPALTAAGRYLLPALGLSGHVPGAQGQAFPMVDWGRFAELGPGLTVGDIFAEWFSALARDPQKLKIWLGCVGAVFTAKAPERVLDLVAGQGARSEPFRVALTGDGQAAQAQLDFTLGRTQEDSGVITVFPGFALRLHPVDLTPDVRLNIGAEMECLGLRVAKSDGAQSGENAAHKTSPAKLSFQAGITLANTDPIKPLLPWPAKPGDMSLEVGRLTAGLALKSAGNSALKLAPVCRLTALRTKQGYMERLDLTDLTKLVDTAQKVLVETLKTKFQQLLGFDDQGQLVYAPAAVRRVAAAVGFTPPTGLGAHAWPFPPPLGVDRLDQLLTRNPIESLFDYYRACLTATVPVGEHLPFVYLFQDLVGLLAQKGSEKPGAHPPEAGALAGQSAGQTIQLCGKGSAASPWVGQLTGEWQCGLLAKFTPEAAAKGADETKPGGRLELGLRLIPPVSIGQGATARAGQIHLDFWAFRLGFKAGAGLEGVSAGWLESLSATLALDGGETPPVCDTRFKVQGFAFGSAWNQTDSWSIQATARQPVVTVGQRSFDFGGDLDLSDPEALTRLITDAKQRKAFSPALAAILGQVLSRLTHPAGKGMTALLGLLPEMGSTLPPAVGWPNDLTELGQDMDLANPFPRILGQLMRLTETPDRRAALARLLAWMMAQQPDRMQPPPGSGTRTDPFRLRLGAGQALALALWTDPKQSRGQGVGLIARQEITVSQGGKPAITLAVEFRLDVGTLRFTPGPGRLEAGADFEATPRLYITVDGRGVDQPLVDDAKTTGLTIQAARFRLGAGLAKDGQPTLWPCLQATLAQDDVLTLDPNSGESIAEELRLRFETALGLAAEAIMRPLGQAPWFKDVYDVLGAIGLVIAVDPEQAAAEAIAGGINSAGLAGLLADPQRFLSTRLAMILTDEGLREKLFGMGMALVGLPAAETPSAKAVKAEPSLLPIQEPVGHVLHALGLVMDQAHGFAPRLQAILELAQDPLGTLAKNFADLVALGKPALEALATLLPEKNYRTDLWGWAFEIFGARKIIFTVPPSDPLRFSIFAASGRVAFDLQDGLLQATARLGLPEVGVAVKTDLGVVASGEPPQPDITVALDWGDGVKPAPAAITLCPLKPEVLLDQVTELAPAFALSSLVTTPLESWVLGQSELAFKLLKGVGLAYVEAAIPAGNPASATDRRRLRPLNALFQDPAAWLQSVDLYNFATLQTLLVSLPEVTHGAVRLKNVANGKQVTGLPYAFALDLTVLPESEEIRVKPYLQQPIALGSLTVRRMDLLLCVGSGLQVKGAGTLEGMVKPATGQGLLFSTGYRDQFFLGLKTGDLALQLIPFPGWQELLNEMAELTTQGLMRLACGKIMALLKQSPTAKTFAINLEAAWAELNKGKDLLEALEKLYENPEITEADVLDTVFNWLTDRFSQDISTVLHKITEAINPLFGNKALSHEGNLLTYQKTIGGNLQAKVLMGRDDSQGADKARLGLWLDLSPVPSATGASLIVIEIHRSGMGFPLNAAKAEPEFTAAVKITAMVEKQRGPSLVLGYANNFSATDPMGRLTLHLDPDYSLENGGRESRLKTELYPQPFKEWGGTVTNWGAAVLVTLVPRYFVNALIMKPAVQQWLKAPLMGRPPQSLTMGELLIGAQVMQQEEKNIILRPPDILLSLQPAAVVFGLLKTLLGRSMVLYEVDGQGRRIQTVKAEPLPGDQGELYGLQLQLAGLKLGQGGRFTLDLGGMKEQAAWLVPGFPEGTPLQTGLLLRIPIRKEPEVTDLRKFRASVVDLGLTVGGRNSHPLVDKRSFRLGRISPRGMVEVDFGVAANDAITRFGGIARAEGLGLPLGPVEVSGSGNPVAENIMGAAARQTLPQKPSGPGRANPCFNIGTRFLGGPAVPKAGQGFGFTFTDEAGNDINEIWLRINRSFGPLHVERVGAGYLEDESRQPFVRALFGGGLELFFLSGSVRKMALGIPLKSPLGFENYRVDLEGVSLNIDTALMTVGGALIKSEPQDGNPPIYTGAVNIGLHFTVFDFGITGVGSYGVIKTPEGEVPSLFLFGVLDLSIGTPMISLEGFCGGFAVHRGLLIPDIGEMHNFPLVQGAHDPSLFVGKSAAQVLTKLTRVAPPKQGAYWLAGGIKFSLVTVIQCTGMITVSFGDRTAINILGMLEMSVPPLLGRSLSLVYLKAVLKVAFRPSEGIISVEGRVTPDSFVLSERCRITGGFALYVWYGADNPDRAPAGMFVFTTGGYHPRFMKPAYFPAVPRLGLELSLGPVSAVGHAYMALTPSGLMAGGYIDVSFELGLIRAWFKTHIHFLLLWDPLYIDFSIGVSVGVGFGFNCCGAGSAITAEIGCDLVLAGPPLHGEVKVDWVVVSFTISFGGPPQPAPVAISWSRFAHGFLPKPRDGKQQVLTSAPLSGRLGSGNPKLKPEGPWRLSPDGCIFAVRSAVPITEMTWSTPSGEGRNDPNAVKMFGVRPVGCSNVASRLSIQLARITPGAAAPGLTLGIVDLTDSAPAALWSQEAFNFSAAPTAEVLEGLLVGQQFASKPMAHPGIAGSPYRIVTLLREELKAKGLPFFWRSTISPAPALAQDKPHARVAETIMRTDVIQQRNQILSELEAMGIPIDENPDLSVLGYSGGRLMQAPPTLGKLSESCITSEQLVAGAGAKQITVAAVPAARSEAAAPAAKMPVRPHRLAVAKRQRINGSAPGLRPLAALAAGTPGPLYHTFLTDERQGWPGSRGVALNPGTPHKMKPGDLLYVEIPAGLESVTLSQDAKEVRVACFDSTAQLLLDRTTAETEIRLPKEAVRVAVQALGNQAAGPRLYGWSRETEVFQATQRYFMADGCLLRTQAPVSIPRDRMRAQAFGPAGAGDLQTRNLVGTGGEGAAAPGALATRFCYPAAAILVLLRPGKPAASQTADRVCDAAHGSGGQPLQKIEVKACRAYDGLHVALFDLKTMIADLLFNVRVTDPDWRLAGVYGWDGQAVTAAAVSSALKDGRCEDLESLLGKLSLYREGEPDGAGGTTCQVSLRFPAAKNQAKGHT